VLDDLVHLYPPYSLKEFRQRGHGNPP
jgi:hypothetical protein